MSWKTYKRISKKRYSSSPNNVHKKRLDAELHAEKLRVCYKSCRIEKRKDDKFQIWCREYICH